MERKTEDYNELGKAELYVHYPSISVTPEKGGNIASNKVSHYRKIKQTMKIGFHGLFAMLRSKKSLMFHHLPK